MLVYTAFNGPDRRPIRINDLARIDPCYVFSFRVSQCQNGTRFADHAGMPTDPVNHLTPEQPDGADPEVASNQCANVQIQHDLYREQMATYHRINNWYLEHGPIFLDSPFVPRENPVVEPVQNPVVRNPVVPIQEASETAIRDAQALGRMFVGGRRASTNERLRAAAARMRGTPLPTMDRRYQRDEPLSRAVDHPPARDFEALAREVIISGEPLNRRRSMDPRAFGRAMMEAGVDLGALIGQRVTVSPSFTWLGLERSTVPFFRSSFLSEPNGQLKLFDF